MRSDRFVTQPATAADSAEILRILEESVLPGDISLVTTRRPDAYRSFLSEGQEARLIVCRDTQKGRIAGFGARAIHECFIEQRPEKIAYVFGLRGGREYLATRAILSISGAYRQMIEECQAQGIRHCLSVILRDNQRARRLLTEERAGMPRHTHLCRYHTLTFRTRRGAYSPPAAWVFRRATADDRPALEEFLTAQGGRSNFFPCGIARQFARHPELSWDAFHLLTDRQGAILACGAAWDQVSYKQYQVAGYAGRMRWLRRASPLLRLLGYPAIPAPSTTLRFFVLAFWCVRENRADYLKAFLESLARAARDYPYFVTGVPQVHPLGPALNAWKFVGYDSDVYLAGQHVTPEEVARLTRSLYLECGWL